MSWADIVNQYKHHGKTWADLAEEDEAAEEHVGESNVTSGAHTSYASAVRVSGGPGSEQQADLSSTLPLGEVGQSVLLHASYASAVRSSLFDEQADVSLSGTSQPALLHASYAGAVRSSLPIEPPRASLHAVRSSDIANQPGDPVGIQAIQSILMSATQKSLSHFHTAGMAGYVYTRQKPSAADAMDSTYTINNTSMTFESNLDVHTLRKQLVGASMSSFVRTVGSSLTGLPDRENVWYEVLGRGMYSGSLLRIYVDYNKMRDHGLTLEDLARETFKGATTSVSPDFMGMIDVEIPDVYLSPWLSAMNVNVFGTPDILSCDIGPTSAATTRGTNILAVSRVPSVNKRSITSNNVSNVEVHFGVEAAASVLHSLTKSHIVSDFMARTGKVLPFTKNSKEVTNKGLLTSMGFERPKDDIKNTVTGKARPQASTLSVYESIITGTDPPDNFMLSTNP